jgi:peptidoglycan/LPS O-acetylase OafA/YrhL
MGSTARFAAADGLRGLAALGVFTVHAGSIALLDTGQLTLAAEPGREASYGLLGVAMVGGGMSYATFFVLSGYLISRPFVRAFIYDEPLPRLVSYLRNRALRILPALWLAFTVVLLLSGVPGKASTADVIGIYTMVSSWHDNPFGGVFAQAWTLWVEVRFYLLVPLVSLLGVGVVSALRVPVGPRVRLAAVLACGLGVVVATCIEAPSFTAADLRRFDEHVYVFVPGVMLAALEPWLQTGLAGRRLGRWLGLGLAVLGTGMLLAWEPVSGAMGTASATPWVLRLYIAGAAGAVVAGLLIAQWGGWKRSVFTWAPIRWLGERSYSFYLLHMVVLVELAPLVAVGGYKRTLLILYPAALGITALAAEISYRLVERPLLRRKDGARSDRVDLGPTLRSGELAGQQAGA